jgi:DNA-binding NtrC family response regulator
MATRPAPQMQSGQFVGTTCQPATQAQPQTVAHNVSWRKLVLRAEVVAPHLRCAVIEGEPGVGKQTLARFLHSRSIQAKSAFQRHDAREWLATKADPATATGFIYLDRVDLLASPGQAVLLSVLKALEDRPSGRTVLIASSESSLAQMARQGSWIPDLAFRLTAVRFAVPPLRQRRADLAGLAQELLARISQRYRQRPVTLEPGALSRLLEHNWPGNVRELASVLETAALDAANGVIRAEGLSIADQPPAPATSQRAGQADNLALDAVIRNHVHSVLEANHGNKLRAAQQLGISRSTLYRILNNESVFAG